MKPFTKSIVPLICVSLWISAGCGNSDGLTRAVVTGNVSLQNAPVEDGQIRYIPIDGTAGPTIVSLIRNGKYRCDHNGGVPVGKHRVEILVWDPSVPPPMGPGSPARPQWAPERYNQESELVFEVEASGGEVQKDWNL